MDEEKILEQTLQRAKNLRYRDKAELDDIRRKGRMALENLFPTKTYWIDIGNIKFEQFHYVNTPESTYIKEWQDGQNQLINLLDTAIKDRQISKTKKVIPTEKEIIVQEKIVPIIDESAIRELKQQFSEYRRSVKNWFTFGLLLVLTSSCLWLLFFNSTWDWYSNHPKKLGITLLTNLTLLIGLLNIPIKKQWTIWVVTIFAILTTLFSIL